MSTKNDVLAALMSEQEPLSGERLARKLGISRNSVWMGIQQLRRDGYQIEAGTNRGYRLVNAPDRVNAPEIAKWLNTEAFGARMELHDKLDSTNTLAKALAAKGAPHGYLVVAESQSGGRGRLGRGVHGALPDE